MGMLSILYVSTAYILTTDLKKMQKNLKWLVSVRFFLQKLFSFIFNVAHFGSS